MPQNVIKRDKSIVEFDRGKIESAISKAYKEVYPQINISNYAVIISNATDKIYKEILWIAGNNENIDIEIIQDIVERELMELDKSVAKEYITYRYTRKIARDNYDLLMDAIKEKLMATNVQNQNANVDEHSFGGRLGEATDLVSKRFALDNIISDMQKENHLNNIIYIHDLSHYAIGDHNCLSIPFDDLLKNGFNTRQTDVRPAQSVNTAFQLLAVIFQLQSLQQFGGVSSTHLDWTMVPYVRKSFLKHYITAWLKDTEDFANLDILGMIFDDYEENVEGHIIVRNRFDDWVDSHKEKFFDKTQTTEEDYVLGNKDKLNSKYYQQALYDTIIETKQAVEGMYHNLNTLQSRSGNQLPFTSINYGTCTSLEGRLITRCVLECSIKGIGKLHKTSIFPCGIFQCMSGVNRKPNEPNYDLFRLALKSTAMRLYPNYCNVDWSGNAGYDVNDPRTYFSTMGALAGHEHLYVRINGNEPIDISIKDLFCMCKGDKSIKGRPAQIYYNKCTLKVETNLNWRKVQDKEFRKSFKSKPGVYKITYILDDVSYIGSTSNVLRRFNEHRANIKHTGGLDAGQNFNDTNIDNYKFEVLEYTENYKSAEDKYIMSVPNINFRGVDKKFYKNIGLSRNKGLDNRPDIYMDPTIPQDIIDLNESDIMVLDRDNKWVKVKHIFKNSKMNTPYMMHISYLDNDKEYTLCCTEDHPLWVGDKFVKASELTLNDKLYRGDNKELTITRIKWHTDRAESYDIGTETGSFIGSDIIMHNCRTANGWDINGLGQLKDGRGNICPVSIILPTIAMMAKEEISKNAYTNQYSDDESTLVELFMLKLNVKINEAKDMLIERFNWICSQSPDSAKFMYENGLMAGYVKEEGIKSALKHGTLAIGQLGLAETLQILIGCNHTTEKGMKLAKRIEQLFKDRCSEFKTQYKLNFGVYFTPAENLCFTAMTKFKEKYGVIPNVSDKDYFTNSIHVPVWEEMTPFEKIDIESQLTGYSSAGCITYVELDSSVKNNIDSLEVLVNYAMDKDIPYLAINLPNDLCLNCGFTDEINDTCPMCNSKDIRRLRRVTGYLTGDYKTAFNKGKQQEVEQRVKHTR